MWRGKDSNLRRRKPADLQSAPVGRLGTPPQKEPRILISGSWRVNAAGPLFAWGSAAMRRIGPAAPRGSPSPQAQNRGLPGELARGRGSGPRPGPSAGADRAFQAPDQDGIGAACLAGAQVAGQFDRAVADAQQAAHLETHRAPQPADLAVSPLAPHDPEGAVTSRPLFVRALRADAIETRRTVTGRRATRRELRGGRRGRRRSRGRRGSPPRWCGATPGPPAPAASAI